MAKDKGEKLAYRVHEMAAAFPLPSAEEYAAIKESVAQVGFVYPKVFWTDGNGDTWLIDGRTRDRIETEFEKADVKKAANGRDLKCEAAVFQGTESEAVAYVRGLNLNRRAMNSGQKAAAAVLSGEMYKRYKAKEEGAELLEDKEEELGDVAARMAKDAGTNRDYIFVCLKLSRKYPDLLLRVLAGGPDGLSIPNAKKIMKRRDENLPDEEPEGGEEPVEVTPDDKPETVYDGLKNEVPDDLLKVFCVRATVKAAKKKIRDAINELEEVKDDAGAKNMSFQTFKSDANNAIRHLEDHQPHAQCPYCSGTGKDAENNAKKCGHCKGRKWLDKVQWKQVPPELRALYEKKAPDDKGEDDDEDKDGGKYGQ